MHNYISSDNQRLVLCISLSPDIEDVKFENGSFIAFMAYLLGLDAWKFQGQRCSELTSRNCISPISPNALTTSRPISLAMYSWVNDMSAERKRVSLGTAMTMNLPVQATWGFRYEGSQLDFAETRVNGE